MKGAPWCRTMLMGIRVKVQKRIAFWLRTTTTTVSMGVTGVMLIKKENNNAVTARRHISHRRHCEGLKVRYESLALEKKKNVGKCGRLNKHQFYAFKTDFGFTLNFSSVFTSGALFTWFVLFHNAVFKRKIHSFLWARHFRVGETYFTEKRATKLKPWPRFGDRLHSWPLHSRAFVECLSLHLFSREVYFNATWTTEKSIHRANMLCYVNNLSEMVKKAVKKQHNWQ